MRDAVRNKERCLPKILVLTVDVVDHVPHRLLSWMQREYWSLRLEKKHRPLPSCRWNIFLTSSKPLG